MIRGNGVDKKKAEIMRSEDLFKDRIEDIQDVIILIPKIIIMMEKFKINGDDKRIFATRMIELALDKVGGGDHTELRESIPFLINSMVFVGNNLPRIRRRCFGRK